MSNATNLQPIRSFAACAAAIAAVIACTACTPLADGMLTRVEARVAQDQLMFVRQQPPTFGYHRLLTSMREFPDLATFVNQRGMPDFIAETGDRSQRFIILYYLAERQAFACRTISSRSRAVEFAGPYPITDREFQTLSAIRDRSE